jgi:hypothetical protein
VLWELRGALRAGNVWLPGSRRYGDPETHLIPKDRWPALRAEVCRQLQTPEDPTVRLQERAHELEDRLVQVDALLARGEHIRMEDGALIVPRLEAEDRPASMVELEQRIDARLPLIDLSELRVEVDEWTQFSQWFEHASGYEPPTRELRDHLYAVLLAQGCNIGLRRMAHRAPRPPTGNWPGAPLVPPRRDAHSRDGRAGQFSLSSAAEPRLERWHAVLL